MILLARYFNSVRSSFKVRARLAQFFKHTHPDLLQHAPEKVKLQNMQALTQLNEYIDAALKNNVSPPLTLRFHVGVRANLKAKHFKSLLVQAPAIQQGPEQTRLGQLQQLIDLINNRLLDTKPGVASDYPPGQAETKGNATSEKELDSRTRGIESQRRVLKTLMKEKQMQQKYDQLRQQIERTQLKSLLPSSRSHRWNKMLRESEVQQQFQQIQAVIDPRGLLTAAPKDHFAQKEQQLMLEVFSSMQNADPPISLLVGNNYGVPIPGFFQVPFDFKPAQLHQQYRRVSQRIIQDRNRYDLLFDRIKRVREELLQRNNISAKVRQPRNSDEAARLLLTLKRLTRHRPDSKVEVAVVLSGQDQKSGDMMVQQGFRDDEVSALLKGAQM